MLSMVASLVAFSFAVVAVTAAEEDHIALPMHVPMWAMHHLWMRPDKTLIPGHEIDKLQSRSQFGEELHLVQNYFYGLGKGTFIELGALDGLEFCNTVGLERDLGWRGLMIEGSPASYTKLVKNRPAQTLINSCICKNISTVHYLDYVSGFDNPAVFGIWEFMTSSHKEMWFPDLNSGKKSVPESSAVPCVPLGSILNLFHVTHINLFSLDVEGGELQVLQSINFDRIKFDVMIVEGRNEEVLKLLQSKGYVLVEDISLNRWFVREGFKRSIAPNTTKIEVIFPHS